MGTAYVTSGIDDYISVINTSNWRNKGSICVDGWQSRVAPPTRYNKLWFIEQGNRVAVANLTTNQVYAHVQLPHIPTAIVLTPDATRVYVSGYEADTGYVWVINAVTKKIIKTITLDLTYPVDIALSPDNRWIYVVSSNPSFFITINRVTGAVDPDFIETGGYSSHVAISPTRDRAYVTNSEESITVSVINLSARKLIKDIDLDVDSPEYIAVTPDQKYAYITHPIHDKVSVINLNSNTVLRTFTCLGEPNGLAMTLDNRYVYINQRGKSRVAIYSRKSLIFVKTIATGKRPEDIVITVKELP